MTEEKQENKKTVNTKKPTSPSFSAKATTDRKTTQGKRPFRKNPRRFSRKERPRSDLEQRVIGIRRVARVVKGGRRFSFAVAIVVGDKKGSVGVGTGKGTDTSLAIGKASRNAKKNMAKISLTKTMSIPTDVEAKYSASVVQMRPSPGKGVSAGSSVRDVIEMAGIKDITAKLLSRSKNKLNNALATVKALKSIQR